MVLRCILFESNTFSMMSLGNSVNFYVLFNSVFYFKKNKVWKFILFNFLVEHDHNKTSISDYIKQIFMIWFFIMMVYEFKDTKLSKR